MFLIQKVLKKHARYKFFNKIYVAGNLRNTQKRSWLLLGN